MAAKYVPFFESFWLAVKDLTDEERLKIYDAVLSYGFNGEMPQFPESQRLLNVAFELMRPNIDKAIKRAEANSRAGRASGEARTSGNAS